MPEQRRKKKPQRWKQDNLHSRHPDVVLDWDYCKNEKPPSQFAPYSNKYAFWVCHDCGHEWRTKIINRTHTLTRSGCPFCQRMSARRIRLTPEVGQSAGDLYPELIPQLHLTKNEGKTLFNAKPSSQEMFWWVCPVCTEEYPQMVYRKVGTKTRKGTGCPYCEGKKIGRFNNLAYRFPEIAEEWADNNKYPAHKMFAGSSERGTWKCRICSHTWEASISNRTGRKSGCPRCRLKGVSKWQLQIFDYVQKTIPSATLCAKPLMGQAHAGAEGRKLEADVLIENAKLVIETDGFLHHKDKLKQDKYKNTVFEMHGYRVLRIRALPLEPISDLDIVVHPQQPIGDYMPYVMGKISALTGENYDLRNILLDSIQHLSRQYIRDRSLATKYPDLVGEYSDTNLLPADCIMAGSNEVVLWKGKCGHQWHASVASRTSGKQGCPIDAGKIVIPETSLASTFPMATALWDCVRNGDVTPDQVTPHSGERYYWLCPNGHSTIATVQAKVRPWVGDPDCPRYREVGQIKYYFGCRACYDALRTTEVWKSNLKRAKRTAYLRGL